MITVACTGLHLFIPVRETRVLILLPFHQFASVLLTSDLFQLYNVRENRNRRSARSDSGIIASLLPFPSLCRLPSQVLL